MNVAIWRPYAIRSGGTGATVAAAITASTTAAISAPIRRAPPSGASAGDLHTSMTTAPIADMPIIHRCASRVPTPGMISRLNARAPTIAPTVLAAYTLPTTRPGSWARDATALSARGKLAPQKNAAGTIEMTARRRSIWKLNHGPAASAGSIGQ